MKRAGISLALVVMLLLGAAAPVQAQAEETGLAAEAESFYRSVLAAKDRETLQTYLDCFSDQRRVELRAELPATLRQGLDTVLQQMKLPSITPHVVHSIEGGQLDTLYQKRRYTKVEPRYYEEVVKGMRQAVLGGTCRGANLPDIEVCGKTGTAENRGHDHSAFMGFAPMDNPKIAIAVYVENGGFGAVYGVPIGKLMIEQYLKGKLSPESEAQASEIQQRRIFYDNQQR